MFATQSDRLDLLKLPKPSARRIAMRVSPDAERALRQGHPWIFDKAISYQSHAGHSGDLAVIFDHKREFLAVGLYDPHASIRVRILQNGEPAAINPEWFSTKLESAAQIREPLLHQPPESITTGYRLLHGENDGMPGLVIDRYEQTLVIKLYTPAWIPHLRDVVTALESIVPLERLVLRIGRSMASQPQELHHLCDGMILSGSDLDGPVFFWENGLRFEANPVFGQKTGFFLDQRDNRARVGQLARKRNVLNVFAYTGGFSVYAARGGAIQITNIDTSQAALDAAIRNLAYNQHFPSVSAVKHENINEDAFRALARLAKSGVRFDMVIIDPPAFAQKQSQVTHAISAYEQLAFLGLGVLQPGGTLVQASCSSRVDAETFFETVNRAADRAGRHLHNIEHTGHALDHPITYREGAYLKCLFATAS